MIKKLLLGIVALLLVALLGLGIAVAVMNKPRPSGTAGPEAEALAAKMLAAVHADAWAKTGAVRWTFPRGHEHLWDRRRNLARVRWSGYEALIDIATKRGVVTRGGAPVSADAQQQLVEKAWALWANDSFWLNPVVKVRDGGTKREVVTAEDGSKALLVTYSSGGVTPGDAYLWLLNPDGTPRAWRMWVQIIPVGGLEFAFEGWTTLPTGARVAADHPGVVSINLRNIKAAATLAELEPGADPFLALVKQKK